MNVSIASGANDKLLDAQSKGAVFLIGGPGYHGSDRQTGLKPTIVTGVTPEMAIWEEETFGPSASLYTFTDDEDAVAMANKSVYGLNAAIHTTNMERAIDMARKLEVGQVHINNLTEYDEGMSSLSLLRRSDNRPKGR